MRFVLFLLALSLLPDPAQEKPGAVDFERDIRPIFKASCIKCHGPDKSKANLRLHSKAAARKGGDSGPAYKPGDSKGSRLLQLLLSKDDEERMPQKAPALAAAQIDLIRRWIDQGAPWPDDGREELHWSLRPLVKPPVPTVKAAPWVRTPIDSFILASLESKGLSPAPPADRRTLLRRLTFDLTGLAPTREELESFLADPDPDAHLRAIDRLLASPRTGERWARHWLDAVHYADTHGHDQDRPRPNAWPYRDYVVRSFNEDTPWARFVQEQLAGDVLFPGDPQGVVALGFLAAGPWDESSQMHIMADTVDKKIAQNLDRDDMLMATMSTFMSSTVHCARCHDHKFDPFSQAEYYALQSCFAGVDRSDRPYDADPAVHQRRQALLRRMTDLEARPRRFQKSLSDPDLQVEVAAWVAAGTGREIPWTVLQPEIFASAEGATLTKLPDGSILSEGECPQTDTVTISARTELRGITAIRLEVLTHESLPTQGPGRQDNGNFHLSEFRVAAGDPTKPVPVALQNPSADFDQQGWTLAHALDGNPKTAWGIFPEVGKPHVAYFELKEPLANDGGTTLTFFLEQKHGGRHLIARPRLSVTAALPPVRVSPHPPAIAKILAIPSGGRSEAQTSDLAAYYLRTKVERELVALPRPLQVYAATNDFKPLNKFSPARLPRPIHLLKRGDVNHPLAPAGPGGLAALPGLPPVFEVADPEDEGQRRAAIARWITDPRNVLTWRSIVNRVWHLHFGRGLVDSPNDFGRMGGTPSHPELLDWLTATFLEQGGSIKKLHRLILSSSVYLQSSRHDAAAATIDSGNALLWRMNRLRLDAEQVRDSILQASGKLDLTMGGPSVMQFHFEDPNPGVTPKVDYAKYDVDAPGSFRRSIYRYVFRTLPDPFMDTLDCADASQLTAVRNVSMTALQAMALMNNPFVIRQSGHLAARAKDVEGVYRAVLGRAPTGAEASALKAYAEKHGLANAARVLLNSSEFMFLD